MKPEVLQEVRRLAEQLETAARAANFGLHHAGEDREVLYQLIDAQKYAAHALDAMRKEGIYE